MARTHNAHRRSQARSRGVLFLLSNASAAFAAAADAVAIEVSSVDSLFVQCSADSIAPNNSDNIEPTVPHEAEARLQDGFRKTQKIQALESQIKIIHLQHDNLSLILFHIAWR